MAQLLHIIWSLRKATIEQKHKIQTLSVLTSRLTTNTSVSNISSSKFNCDGVKVSFHKLLGLTDTDRREMLKCLDVDSADSLFEGVPRNIRLGRQMNLPPAHSEHSLRRKMTNFARSNMDSVSNDCYLGLGCYDHEVPAVIDSIASRGEFLTAYTPYQPEMSQGLLTALNKFTKKVGALVDLPVVTSSHYDGATALAESCWMAVCSKKRNTIALSPELFPQYAAVLKTYCWGRNIRIVTLQNDKTSWKSDIGGDYKDDLAAVVVQSPNQYGVVEEITDFAELAHHFDGLLIGITHPFFAAMQKPMGQLGFDIVVFEGQSLGLHMFAGGAHLGILACRDELRPFTPGRLIGEVSDINGKPALALTYEDREQHIARDRATSNICSNQALNAVRAGAFLTLHGATGLAQLGNKCQTAALAVREAFKEIPLLKLPKKGEIFQEFVIRFKTKNIRQNVSKYLLDRGVLAGLTADKHKGLKTNELMVSFTETKSIENLKRLVTYFCEALSCDPAAPLAALKKTLEKRANSTARPAQESHPDLQPTTEISLIRQYTRYSRMNFGVDTGSYPLGSCTMKYNPKRNDAFTDLAGFQGLHPLQPITSMSGLQEIYQDLQAYISEIIGMDFVDLTPAAGAHGELKGLMVARQYFADKGETHRNEVIIPDSAHGTNPASASMVGFKCRIIPTREDGLMDILSLKNELSNRTAVVMTTNPSTFGLFEEEIENIVNATHSAGALTYYDGANMNALMGHSTPGKMGFDIAHINLHKTLATPHGGGGPGAGPVGVKKFLRRYISAGFKPAGFDYGPLQIKLYFGHISVLLRAYAYILSMGPEGLRQATSDAVLNTNYLMHRLKDILPPVFDKPCMHEALLDGSNLPISTLDLSKRMIDFGIHPPTLVGAGCVYFGENLKKALLFEPTESESKAELDYIAETIIRIVKDFGTDQEFIYQSPHSTPVGRILI